MRVTAVIISFVLVFFSGCRESRDQLLEKLSSPDSDTRMEALRKLARQSTSDNFSFLLLAAKDPVPDVRAEALSALLRSQDARLIESLGELLADANEGVQASAAMALAEMRNDNAQKYLMSQYSRRGKSTRRAIVQALKASNVPGAMAQVVVGEASAIWERNLKTLAEGSLPEKVGAAEEIGKSGRVEALHRLLPLLKHSHIPLAAAAARGLGYVNDVRAVGPLADVLLENSTELRMASCEALSRLRGEAALPKLKLIAQENSSASRMAVKAIVALPDTETTRQALCELSLAAGRDESLLAAQTMRSRGGCHLKNVLAQLDRPSTQPLALNALRGLGVYSKEILLQVLPLAKSPFPIVRRRAFEFIAMSKDASAASALTEVDVCRDNFHEAEGAPVPSRNFPWDSDSPMSVVASRHTLEYLDDSEAATKAAGLWALGATGAPGAKRHLESCTKDSNPIIRAGAWKGLSAMSKGDVSALRLGLKDESPWVRLNVAETLANMGPEGQKLILPSATFSEESLLMLQLIARAGPNTEIAPWLIEKFDVNRDDAVFWIRAIGETKSPQAVEKLLMFLRQSTSAARHEAITALRKIGDVRAISSIGEDLFHDSPEARASAADALSALGCGTHGEALDALTGDYYRFVREAAAWALKKCHEGANAERRE